MYYWWRHACWGVWPHCSGPPHCDSSLAQASSFFLSNPNSPSSCPPAPGGSFCDPSSSTLPPQGIRSKLRRIVVFGLVYLGRLFESNCLSSFKRRKNFGYLDLSRGLSKLYKHIIFPSLLPLTMSTSIQQMFFRTRKWCRRTAPSPQGTDADGDHILVADEKSDAALGQNQGGTDTDLFFYLFWEIFSVFSQFWSKMKNISKTMSYRTKTLIRLYSEQNEWSLETTSASMTSRWTNERLRRGYTSSLSLLPSELEADASLKLANARCEMGNVGMLVVIATGRKNRKNKSFLPNFRFESHMIKLRCTLGKFGEFWVHIAYFWLV